MKEDGIKDSVSLIRELHQRDDWKGVIQLYDEGFNDEKLLWFHPDSDGIKFLKENLKDLGVQGVSSIGCGTGLLEWLISSSTGLPVIGYEIDQGWWESKYSPPKFWNKINCVNPASFLELDSRCALLFCYFNDVKAFEAYLDSFAGNCLILIGPDMNNKSRYCDPPPFQLTSSTLWTTYAVWRGKFQDAIVIYRRACDTLES